MCYAIPGRLKRIKGSIGVIDYFGEERRARLDMADVKAGDYVFAQGGIVVSKVSEEEALKILKVWEELFFRLKDIDKGLSEIKETGTKGVVWEIVQKANRNRRPGRKELKTLLDIKDRDELDLLCSMANNVRQRVHENASCVHGIIEFSNFCEKSCLYCGIRRPVNIERYRMRPEEIVGAAREAAEKYGFRAIVLQSGEDPWYTDEVLEGIIPRIKELGVLVFLSLGDRSRRSYERLYRAGARAALLRFETSNEDIFNKLRPGTALKERVELIKDIRSVGYVLATGFMIGLPGETTEDIVNNIMLTESLGPDMYSFGPLVHSGGSCLETVLPVSSDLILKTIAAARLYDRDSNILITTAMETLDPGLKKKGLMAGGNSMMLNLTPVKYKKLYNIYDDRRGGGEELKDAIEETVSLLTSLGRSPADIGDRQKWS